jgi:hypothetical protein
MGYIAERFTAKEYHADCTCSCEDCITGKHCGLISVSVDYEHANTLEAMKEAIVICNEGDLWI